ncbi:MAG: outer membrane beta-barrel protein [Chitinophagaceae bacterium]|nr:outer membrane beta-barrel protein [Chitinophagaceae bacterium]
MRRTRTGILLLLICANTITWSQDEEFSKMPYLSFFTGLVNYQGDLNPNSFTFGRSKFTAGASVRIPLSRWFTARAGFNIGSLEAADRYNRDYLKPRNLSFFTSVKEVFAALELNLLNIDKSRFTPYFYGGIAVFHFNPWAYDNGGEKIYLQPLSTEGQGILDFPTQKTYKLTQFALPFGAGLKYAVSNNVHVGIEFSQRKTFTDYLDDVSSFYVDRDKLLAAKGSKAVEMAFRGLSSPAASAPYPAHGEQRGTPSEMDWYYFTGINLEVKMSALASLFRGGRDKSYQQRCPRRIL